jgi:hypothetical protein
MNKLLIASFFGVSAVVACGKTVSLDSRPCPCSDGWTCCTDKNVCVQDAKSCGAGGGSGTGELPAPPGGFSSTAVASAKSVCTGDHGPSDAATSAADATSKLAKAWISCNHDKWLTDRGGDAVVFSNDGTWSLFKLDANSALAPLSGLGTRGTWTLYGAGSSAPLDRADASQRIINAIGLTDDGSVNAVPTSAQLAFEQAPSRMRLSMPSASPPEEAWFVPIEAACDEKDPACQCHKQCARILSEKCDSYSHYADWYSSHCAAACESATDAQRQSLAACAPAYACDPTCLEDVGWSPSDPTDPGADGGT